VAVTPQVFTNVVKATALANAQAALSGTWTLRESWDGYGLSFNASTGSGEGGASGLGGPGERWVLPFFAGKIDLTLLGSGNWQAILFPGS
jgi:hypothetical protein